MKLPEFDYCAPDSLEEAVALLSADDDAKLISGGQSLLPVLAFRMGYPSVLVDLRKISGLDRIKITDEGLRVGARVRWVDVLRDTRLFEHQPLFRHMIAHVAHAQVCNRGTVGGSLAHADPAAEMPGVALVNECIIEVIGSGGLREIPASDFFVGPLQTVLEQSEIITGVRFPVWPAERRWAFIEVARRKGDFAMAGIAAYWDAKPDGVASAVHLCAIGAGATPLRLYGAEAEIEGRVPDQRAISCAAIVAASEVSPMGDIHGEADYRRALVKTLTERALIQAAGLEH